jgi:hypothetical protein
MKRFGWLRSGCCNRLLHSRTAPTSGLAFCTQWSCSWICVRLFLWSYFTLTLPLPICSIVVRVPVYIYRGRGFDSQHYQDSWEIVGQEWGLLSFVRITEEVLGRKNGGFGLENWINGHRDTLRWPPNTLYPEKSAITWSAAAVVRSV